MWHKIRIYIIGLCLALSLGVQARQLSEDARISLITCTAGEDLYTKYGHTAIHVCDSVNEIDVVFNYGTFDFNVDHFYWKFVRGETWYELGMSYGIAYFQAAYEQDGRQVYSQELNLSPAEKEALWEALLINYKPENKMYLYNFVFDNCATRPYQIICKYCQDSLVSDYTGSTGRTYREFLRHYTGAYTWANAGINLLFGPKADQPMNSDQRLFLPEELMLYMAQAHRKGDNTPFVKQSTIGAFEPVHTPWYASWPFGLVLYFLFVAGMSYYDRRRKKWSWWVELVAGIPYLLLLLLVTFLTFFSCHPLVGFGWRLLIIPATHLCARLIYIVRR